jgi:hypothetical protein
MLFTAIIFFIALFALAVLFFLKNWELAHDRVLAPKVRVTADRQAMHLKELLEAGWRDLENVPPFLLHAAQRILHGLAVDAARLAHGFSVQANKLADSVSHKRNFQRRETRSEFLKKVSEHQNGNGGNGVSNV